MATTTFYGINIPAEQFPLTHKYRNRIARIARSYRQAPEDTLQDAIICELNMCGITEHKRAAYFMTSVYNNIRRSTYRQYKLLIPTDMQDNGDRLITYDPQKKYDEIYIRTFIDMLYAIDEAIAELVRIKVDNPGKTWMWVWHQHGYERNMRKTLFYKNVQKARDLCASIMDTSMCNKIEKTKYAKLCVNIMNTSTCKKAEKTGFLHKQNEHKHL